MRTGRTSPSQNHRHQVTIDAEGKGSTDIVQGHWHEIDPPQRGDKIDVRRRPAARHVHGPGAGLRQRAAVQGPHRQRQRTGINVGNEWKYRSFIEGGTLAAAIWTFDGLTPERFPDGLPMEMTIRVFRSYKGDIEKGILGSLVLRNPRNGPLQAELETFRPRTSHRPAAHSPQADATRPARPIDLFDDLVPDGELEIELQCLDDCAVLRRGQAPTCICAPATPRSR